MHDTTDTTSLQSRDLVVIENDVPLTTSYIVAEKLGIVHKNLVELIKDHQERIEKHFGFLRFETAKTTLDEQGRGRPEQYVKLTENQAHYILTLSRNTEEAMEVKALFVKAFDEVKQMLLIAQQEHVAYEEERLEYQIARLKLFDDTDYAVASLILHKLSHAISDLKERTEKVKRETTSLQRVYDLLAQMEPQIKHLAHRVKIEELAHDLLLDLYTEEHARPALIAARIKKRIQGRRDYLMKKQQKLT